MDNIKQEAAKHHEEAAHRLEVAAKLHHDAAKQAVNGNFPKAQVLTESAAQAETEASLHATKAGELYAKHDHDVAAAKAEDEAAEAAREAKRATSN